MIPFKIPVVKGESDDKKVHADALGYSDYGACPIC